jgi:hypothetical protein
MRAISAADAISPAVQRTREFLFSPFRWGTFLKLGLVAIITEGVGSNFRSSSHGGPKPEHGPVLPPSFAIAPVWIAAAVAALLLAALLALMLFYLVTRLRFAFFHCLVHNVKEIRPGWYIYREPATRFFWLNVLVGFCFLLVMALVALPFVAGFWRLFHQIPPGGHPDIPLLIALVLPLIPIIILLVLAAVLADIVLRDWMLPHYALDNARAGEAWGWVWARIKAEKREFFVYVLLRLILPTIAIVALFIVLLIPGLVVAASLGMVEYGIHSAFADATGASVAAGIFLEVFFGVLAFGFVLLASVCLGGPLSTAIREYALLFYGGRYQTLGDILFPPPPPPATGIGEPQIA